MIFNIKRFLVFLSICIAIISNVNAENKPFVFDKAKYKEHIEEYKYPKEEEKKPTKKNNIDLPKMNFSQDLFSIIGWSIFAVLIVGGLVYLVYILSKSNNNFITEQESENIINQIEENLIASNLDDLINKAVQSGNYELAVKLNYFKVLKTLVVKELIKYRKDKSNKEYLYELFDTPQFREYKALNNAFDRLRFAKIALTESEYNRFSNQCSTFISLF